MAKSSEEQVKQQRRAVRLLQRIRSEFAELLQLSLEAGTLRARVAYEKYRDESFVKAARAAAITL